MNIGIIGLGHLGEALILGLIKSGVDSKQLFVNARTEKTKESIKKKYPDINVISDKKELVAKVDVVNIVVKPQNAKEVFDELQETNLSNKVIVSLMAGITISDMRKMIHDHNAEKCIVRIMPTISISQCNGVIGICYEGDSSEIKEVNDLFEKLGYLIYLSEDKLDDITVCAASGLAFAAFMMKEYVDACNRLFNDKMVSEEITKRIFENVITITKEENQSLEGLIEKISTKGGTTEAGIEVIRNGGINDVINKCFDSALQRINELEKR
ncbi:MAG: hypothetical protein E7254_05880 [Lachnospiraceae bacterium]|nr:hypothetical protein [Lachnospiraceae bacterium]